MWKCNYKPPHFKIYLLINIKFLFYQDGYPFPLISIVSPRYVGFGLTIIFIKSLVLAKTSLIKSLLFLSLITSSHGTPLIDKPNFLAM